jgi:hypothetical protein
MIATAPAESPSSMPGYDRLPSMPTDEEKRCAEAKQFLQIDAAFKTG